MDWQQLSKTISHALRHAPDEYGLTLDEEGWVPVEALVATLQSRNPAWRSLNAAQLDDMNRRASKQRFEIHDGRIRALYGHSTAARIEKQIAEPPTVLYHGTSPAAATAILAEGLKPMQRQYVHLSVTQEMAQQVGARRGGKPTILQIRAADAHRDGVTFYTEANGVWLADAVPPEYIEALERRQG